MNAKIVYASVLASFCAAALLLPLGTYAAESTAARPNIYDESLDGTRQIAEALINAKKENKRILLQFGANWCGWCHKLHELFNADKGISDQLKVGYIVLLVDVNKGHNENVDTRYGNPTRFGLPVIVILDSDGKILTTKDSGELEEGDHHSSQKVSAFLKEWTPRK